jgi:hypothetical protein
MEEVVSVVVADGFSIAICNKKEVRHGHLPALEMRVRP